MIQDSGDRTEFESGAVRDIKNNKGRCDLMPLGELARITGDDTFNYLDRFKTSGEVRHLEDLFFRMAKCDVADLLLDVSIHFKEGAEKYGEDNWQKGIPVWSYIDSGARHYLKHIRGLDDENHLRAFYWNVLCCMWTCNNMIHLNTYAQEA